MGQFSNLVSTHTRTNEAEVPSPPPGLISEQRCLEKFKNRKVSLMLLSNVRYLARQSLPLRGNWDESSKAEENSNFHQLIKLRSQQDPEILEWLQQKSNKYTSPEIQNEMLEAMALGLFREISANIQNATFYTIMADETADISDNERLVTCIRWVDENFVVHEDFLGIHLLERTTADDIVFIIKDVLLRRNQKIKNAMMALQQWPERKRSCDTNQGNKWKITVMVML